MDEAIRTTIEAIHAGPHGVVLVCAGGGASAVEWLLAVPGATATVLEALVPYSRPAMVALLGEEPGHSTSPEAAAAMADRAYERARRWAEDFERPVLGAACTAALATNYAKRGEHRVVVALRDPERVTLHAVTLVKGARDRQEEEQIASRLLLRALAEACGMAAAFEIGLRAEEPVVVSRLDRASAVARLLVGELEWLVVLPDGQMLPNGRLDAALFSGAFNPLHAGHRRLAAVAAETLGRPVAFELSVENVDKPPLSEAEVRRRLRQFEGVAPVVLTRAPTFRCKAELFPGATFVIGYDTLERLFAPRYYGGEKKMQAALEALRASGARFLIAGRRVGDAFHGLDDFPLPEAMRPLFTALSRERFESPLSSTALRAERQQSEDRRG
jgi:Cytidylyltransferase-like